jgi:hypothetical protein
MNIEEGKKIIVDGIRVQIGEIEDRDPESSPLPLSDEVMLQEVKEKGFYVYSYVRKDGRNSKMTFHVWGGKGLDVLRECGDE